MNYPYKLSNFPAFIQLEHTVMVVRFPFLVTLTLCRLGFHLLLLRLWA
jgi:hypothetical protein